MLDPRLILFIKDKRFILLIISVAFIVAKEFVPGILSALFMLIEVYRSIKKIYFNQPEKDAMAQPKQSAIQKGKSVPQTQLPPSQAAEDEEKASRSIVESEKEAVRVGNDQELNVAGTSRILTRRRVLIGSCAVLTAVISRFIWQLSNGDDEDNLLDEELLGCMPPDLYRLEATMVQSCLRFKFLENQIERQHAILKTIGFDLNSVVKVYRGFGKETGVVTVVRNARPIDQIKVKEAFTGIEQFVEERSYYRGVCQVNGTLKNIFFAFLTNELYVQTDSKESMVGMLRRKSRKTVIPLDFLEMIKKVAEGQIWTVSDKKGTYLFGGADSLERARLYGESLNLKEDVGFFVQAYSFTDSDESDAAVKEMKQGIETAKNKIQDFTQGKPQEYMKTMLEAIQSIRIRRSRSIVTLRMSLGRRLYDKLHERWI